MGSTFFTAAGAADGYGATRSVFTLSNGDAAAVVLDNGTIRIFTSTDRVNWTQRASYITSFPNSGIANWWNCNVGDTNNIHVVWRDSANNLKWVRATWSSGNAYAFGTNEVVAAAATPNLGRFEIEILQGDIPFIGVIQYASPATFRTYIRTSTPAWVASYSLQISNAAMSGWPGLTMARDLAGASGGNQRLSFVVCVPDKTRYSGDVIGLGLNVTIATGAVVNNPTILSNLFTATSKSLNRDYQLFSIAAGKYDLMCAVGQGSLDIRAARYTNSAQLVGLSAAPIYNGTVRGAYARSTTDFDRVKFVHSGYGMSCLFQAKAFWDGRIHSFAITCVPSDSGITWIPPNYEPGFPGDWWDYYASGNVSGATNVDQDLTYIYGGGNRNLGFARAESVTYRNSDRKWTYVGNTPSFTPTNFYPAANATINSNTPTVQSKLDSSTLVNSRRRVVFQFARDSAFTSQLKTITAAASEYVSILSGSTGKSARTVWSKVVTSANQMAQGVWYMRSALVDPWGRQGSWSGTTSFTNAHPPKAINPYPRGGVNMSFGTGIVSFDWDFSSSWTGSTQTAYQISIESNDPANPVEIYNSGKIASTASNGTMTIDPSWKSDPLRWRVRVWDEDDVAGPYSDYASFEVVDPSVVAITSPASAAVVNNPTPQVLWSFTAPATDPTVTQRKYRVVIVNAATATTAVDSGWLTGNNGSWTVPPGYLSNAGSWQVTVTVEDSNGIQAGSVTTGFTTSWTPPTAPSFSPSTANFAVSGYLSLTWTDSVIDANFVSWRVYRRLTGTTQWELLREYPDDAASYLFKDYTAGSGLSYDYAVVQAADRFGSVIESVYNVQTVLAASEDYWLMGPGDNDPKLRLDNVKEDSYDDEWEEETIELLGRGRKVEFGTHWGYQGTLTAALYDTPGGQTARQKRQALLDAKLLRTSWYLKNPFGDVWLVSMGNLNVSRVAGVGQREFVTLGVPYTQLYAPQ